MFRWIADSRWLGKLLLAAWAFLALVGVGSLAVNHTVAMPEANNQPLLVRGMLGLRQGASERFLVHVIYAGCSCTERLFAHLVKRGPFAGAEEIVLFVGEDPAKRAAAERAGFRFASASPEELARRFGLEAAPVLVVFDRNGKLRYAGGYFSHPATLAPLDERIHAQLASGAVATPLPVFGCAVSAGLQRSVDPLGIVYSR